MSDMALGGYLPPFRAIALLAALLVGAYGLNAGLAATGLILSAYASMRYATVTGLAWVRFTRRRVSTIKLLDDKKMRAFQRVTLRIFDLPHHPRRLRQAVRRWREWRSNRDFLNDATRGDGLSILHDDVVPGMTDADGMIRKKLGASTPHDGSNAHVSPARAAFEACALTRNLPPDVIARLARESMREVHVAEGEDLFRGRVREDELAVLVTGAVDIGDSAGIDGVEPTTVTRPGALLNSLLDVLEGSRHALRPGGHGGDGRRGNRTRDGRTGEPSLGGGGGEGGEGNTAGPTSAGLKRLGAALAEATAARDGGGDGEQCAPVHIEQTFGDVGKGGEPGDEAGRLAPTEDGGLPPSTTVGAAPNVIDAYPGLSVRLRENATATGTPGVDTPSYPGTPTRAGGGNGECDTDAEGSVSGVVAAAAAADAEIQARAVRESEFSGGPGGFPRLRVRGGDGGCVLAVVPLRDFHRLAGFQLGIQAATMRLSSGYHALCHYLAMPSELGSLWVDVPPPEATPEVTAGGATAGALARLLGRTAAAAVDRSGLDYLLERKGYRPRRKSANYEASQLSDSDADDDDAVSRASSSVSRRTAGGGSVQGGSVELEAMEVAPWEVVRLRTATALLVECGSLEGYWDPPSSRGVGRASGVSGGSMGSKHRGGGGGGPSSPGGRRGPAGMKRTFGGHTSGVNPPVFTAGPGSAVGGFLLLTGQRSAVIIRAGPGGAVVGALPHSAVARLARSHPSVYTRLAVDLAHRLRPSLPARAWDRCGAEWTSLGAGASLAAAGVGHGPGGHGLSGSAVAAAAAAAAAAKSPSAGRHPDGVYVVVTGCLRVAAEVAEVAEVSDLNLGDGSGAQFLGPGEAVGEDSVLRGGRGSWESGEPRGHRVHPGGSRSVGGVGRQGSHSSTLASALNRTQAVRDTQLLWIPAAGLESLALTAPRAFVSLAWRMGARWAGGRSDKRSDHVPGGVAVGGAGAAAGIHHGARTSGGTPGEASSFLSSDKGRVDTQSAPRTVAVVPVSEGAALALDEFVGATAAALSKSCAVRVADSAARLAEVGQAGVGPLAGEATAHWLAQLEAANDVVILKADPFPSPWSVRCAHHADAILLVAAAEDAPPGPEEGHQLQARLLGGVHGGGLAQRELVLLHSSTEVTPTGTRPWLEAFSVHRHHHIARAAAHGLAPAHAARLARSLRRQSVGLVLAGGGARGFAHVGVLMALEEEGIPVDLLGGTSMGSFVGGIYAKEPTALLARIFARSLAVHMSDTWNQLMDLTLPIVSYFSGFGMNKVLKSLFRGAKIEDCWLPFFCMTLDLISCAPIVHRNGTLWRYVRASMALVGFLPPVCDRLPPRPEGERMTTQSSSSPRISVPGASPSDPGRLHVLVDGGYVNNLPTDVMRAMGARVIVAVDVSGHGLPEARMKPWGDALSGFSLLFRQWLPQWLGGGPTCPTMAAMQSHLPYVTDYANAARRVGTVDVMIRPVVADIPILAFGRYGEIVRAGHEAGLRAIRAWKIANPEILPFLDDGLWHPAADGGARTSSLRRTAALPSTELLAAMNGGSLVSSPTETHGATDAVLGSLPGGDLRAVSPRDGGFGGLGLGRGWGGMEGEGQAENEWEASTWSMPSTVRSSADGGSEWSLRVAAATRANAAVAAAAHLAAVKQQQQQQQQQKHRQRSRGGDWLSAHADAAGAASSDDPGYTHSDPVSPKKSISEAGGGGEKADPWGAHPRVHPGLSLTPDQPSGVGAMRRRRPGYFSQTSLDQHPHL